MAKRAQISWWGPDGEGFKEGLFCDDTGDHRIRIAVPGLGRHGLTQPAIFIDGEKIYLNNNPNNLEAAVHRARQYFSQGRHRLRPFNPHRPSIFERSQKEDNKSVTLAI